MALCEELAPIQFREVITVQKHVAIPLWKLAMPNNYRFIENHFEFGKSTVVVMVVQVLLGKWMDAIKVPEIIAGFQKMKFLNCAGAIDGAHIPIFCPLQGASESVN